MNILDISFFFSMACICDCFLFILAVGASFLHEINSSTSPFFYLRECGADLLDFLFHTFDIMRIDVGAVHDFIFQ